MSVWYRPQPMRTPFRLPPQIPIKTVPSGIRDKGIVGDWLVYRWRGGDHLHDFSGKGNHGTIKGASWKGGRYGWSLLLDGADDYMIVPDSPSLSFTDEITMNVWVNPDVASSIQDVINADADNAGRWMIRLEDNATFEFTLRDLDDVSYTLNEVGSYTANEGWMMLTLTYDGSTLKGYKNGSLVDSLSASFSIHEVTNNIQIGRHPGDTCYVDGRISEIHIYSIAKSGDWIERRFERTKGLFSV